MTWLLAILKICLKEWLMIKYYMIKHLTLVKPPKYDGYQLRLASIFYQFFDKKNTDGVVKSETNTQTSY